MASLLGVVFGEAITRLVPGTLIRTGAAVGFLAIGALMLVTRG
jgi:putative Ca2+/H+ antiporter (TMEM165/GDT1 family)